jgi:hypothetical protein
MASMYCQSADLYDHGLQRSQLPNPGQHVASVDTAADMLELDGHGLRDDAEVRFRSEGGTLPAPLVAGTTYYAIVASDSQFQVAAAAAGTAIPLDTAGSNVLLITPPPIDASIRWASALIDDMLPAHVVPLIAPYPELIIAVTAQLAAANLLAVTQGTGQQDLTDRLERIQRLVSKWAKGTPLRGEIVPKAAGLSTVAAATATDPRGWIPEGGTLP